LKNNEIVCSNNVVNQSGKQSSFGNNKEENAQKDKMINQSKKTTIASAKTFANYVEENGPEELSHNNDPIYLS
jgi:hypothetical protein